MLTKRFKLVVLLLCAAVSAFSQINENNSVQIFPQFQMSLPGARMGDLGASFGGGAELKFQHLFDELPILYMEGDVGTTILPYPGDNLILVNGGLGLGINYQLFDRFSFDVGGQGGWYLGLVAGKEGVFSNPWYGGNVNFFFDLNPNFTVSAGAGYRNYVYPEQMLHHGINFHLGTVLRIGSEDNRAPLGIEEIDVEPVFPILYEYYSDNPFGHITIKNTERSTIEDVNVSFYVEQYMEQPELCAVVPSLKTGDTADIDLRAIFTTGLLGLTDTSKISTNILISYKFLGRRISYSMPYTMRVMGRNSMTWSDDRKAASFVSAKDPTVQLFARNTAGVIREQGQDAINTNLRIALGIFETLQLYGMNYVIDPASSYIELSENEDAVDFIQFPSQTLTFRAGDCDDLSILAASLLESVGIETAFITVPGHIYMAFSLDISKDEARRTFSSIDDFIFIDDNTWVPVETTLISDGFLDAWSYGAREWREYSGIDQAQLYPVHEAWNVFKAATVPGGALPLLFPTQENMINNYNEALDIFVQRELEPLVSDFMDRLKTKDNHRLRNRFGVVYARYGQYRKAEEQFRIALRMNPDYASAMVNMGNIKFLQKDMNAALEMYNRAEMLSPESPTIMAAIAKTRYEMEQYDVVRDMYTDLQLVAPELAEQYAYLNNEVSIAGRASAARSAAVTSWDFEEDDEE